jgi:Prp8 binding protein
MSKRLAEDVEDRPEDTNGVLITTSKRVKEHETVDNRTSSLSAPNILLEGHTQAIFSIAFDATGQHLASASLDRSILLWDVYNDNKNYSMLSGHKNGVTQVCWSKDNKIISSSADKTIGIWDAHKSIRLRKFTSHENIVNSCCIATNNCNMIASASDDTYAILYDIRCKDIVHAIPHNYQLTSVCLSSEGNELYTGGIDNIIR